MNATHASNASPSNLHPAGAPPVHRPRTALLVLYAALVAQLAIWSILASRVGLPASTHAHGVAEADLVNGGIVWLISFTLVVVAATVRYRRYGN
jgi:hypothetical protein